jgi:hypothetical protein
MGLGPSLKTATKVQELTDNHREYVTNHVREREQVMLGKLAMVPLNQQ